MPNLDTTSTSRRMCSLDCGPLGVDETVYRDNRFGLPNTIRIGWCATCGMGVTLDPPTQQELSRLYRETYASEALAGQVPRTSRVGHACTRTPSSPDVRTRKPLEPEESRSSPLASRFSSSACSCPR